MYELLKLFSVVDITIKIFIGTIPILIAICIGDYKRRKDNIWHGLNDLEKRIEDKYLNNHNSIIHYHYLNKDTYLYVKNKKLNEEIENYFLQLYNN